MGPAVLYLRSRMSTRILVILPRIPLPARDGAEVVMSETLSAFRRQGMEVDVFALNPSRQRREPKFLDTLCRSHAVTDIDTDVRLLPLSASLVHTPCVQVGGRSLPMSYWLLRFVNKHALDALEQFVNSNGPYDIIHCETLFTVYYGLCIAWHAQATKVVYRSHNVEWRIQQQLSHDAGINLVKRSVRSRLAAQTKLYEQEISVMVNAIACISDLDSQWYSDASTKIPVRTILPGIREYTMQEHLPTHDSIGFLGSLDWEPNRRGVEWFLQKVWPIIKHRAPNARFEIAGRGSSDFCASINIPDGVVCVGEVESIQMFYNRQDLLVSPLFSGSGVRIKLLEAFACSKAVVTTSQGAEGLHHSAADVYYLADTAEQFAEACTLLLSKEELRQQLGNAARTYVREQYSWDAALHNITELYRMTLQGL